MIYEDAVNDLKQHSRQYAKRQMTWFKNKMSVHWLDKRKYVTSNDVR